MVCLFLNKSDAAGLRLYHRLRQEIAGELVLVSAEELVYAPRFTCSLVAGKAIFCIELSNGRVLQEGSVRAVLNRITHLPEQHLQQFEQTDRAYVATELRATFTFLFSILPNPAFNLPTGMGFCGRYRSPLEWYILAQKAGFRLPNFVYQTNSTWKEPPLAGRTVRVLYFRGCCFHRGNLAEHIKAAVERLGAMADENILELTLRETNKGMVFEQATTQPEFPSIDNNFMGALKQYCHGPVIRHSR